MHRATTPRAATPSSARHCLLMAASHVAHDCVVGDHVIMINGAALTGHVVVEDRATVGGLSGLHPVRARGHLRLHRAAAQGDARTCRPS